MAGRAAALLVGFTLTAGVVGCGNSAPGPGDIAQRYVNALAQGEYATACVLLGRTERERLVSRFGARVPCRVVLARCLPNQATVLKRDQSQLLFATVLTRISGRRATVRVSGTAVARRVKVVTLTNGPNGWRLTSYGRGLSNCRAATQRRPAKRRGH
ncbi:MAG: hypothetical protein ACJ764_12035 [Solirubrobacteraceae bacterium]